MKRVLLVAVIFMSLPALSIADGKKKKPAETKTEAAKKEPKEIEWITSFDVLQAKMQQSPRKVLMDVYTGWCGWCKKMDAATYTNPELIKYVSNNFYAFKLDAERKDTIHFNGKTYFFEPSYKCNTIAMELLGGRLSYPTSVLMLENFQNPTPVPGYMTVPQIEYVLSYFGDNAYKHQKWDEYQKTYHATWDHGAPADMTPPAGH
jgi:thioredoxin-related protein